MGLEVDYKTLKDCGPFTNPMKETIRTFNLSEDFPKTVTMVVDRQDIVSMRTAADLYNQNRTGERRPVYDYSNCVGLVFCNGMVYACDQVISASEWRSFFRERSQEEDRVCAICDTPDIPVTQVVACRTCYKWICKNCAEKLTVNKCPRCIETNTISC